MPGGSEQHPPTARRHGAPNPRAHPPAPVLDAKGERAPPPTAASPGQGGQERAQSMSRPCSCREPTRGPTRHLSRDGPIVFVHDQPTRRARVYPVLRPLRVPSNRGTWCDAAGAEVGQRLPSSTSTRVRTASRRTIQYAPAFSSKITSGVMPEHWPTPVSFARRRPLGSADQAPKA
jgi:hypothetical protein